MIKATLSLFIFAFFASANLHALTIKDLVSVRGVQKNHVQGLGLVVGLKGSGDKKSPERDRMIRNIIHNNGINISNDKFDVKNTSIVMVSGQLPPFGSQGQKVDFTVSTIGDSKSIKGGTLLFTKLAFPGEGGYKKTIYATASGPLRSPVGMEDTQAMVFGKIETEIPNTLVRDGVIHLLLNRPNFVDADRITRQVNQHFVRITNRDIAHAATAGQVNVEVPEQFKKKIVSFIAEINQVPMLLTHTYAKVRLNSKTGQVTMNEKVEISPFATSINDLEVQVGGQNNRAPQPKDMLFFNPKEDIQKTRLQTLVEALNELKATPKEIVEIIKEAHKIGALHAELVIE